MKDKAKVLIIGSGGHASVIVDLLLSLDGYEIIGMVSDSQELVSEVMGITLLGGTSEMAEIKKRYNVDSCVIAVGDNFVRSQFYKKWAHLFLFPSLVHPSAQVSSSVTIGDGVVILPRVAVNANSRIDTGCILNTGSILEHDCEMSDFSSLAPAATIGGATTIGSLSAISIGSTVLHGLSIGDNVVVGAGAVVVKDVISDVLVCGCPAVIVKTRVAAEKYL
jgi:sugar O-acyltransferase (sialic acid O-acetyltransferase NeuD family)